MSRKLPDDPLPWKVLASEYLSRKFWYTVRLEKVQLPNGTVIQEYWVSEFLPWVNVVAVTTEQRVLLVRQYRHGSASIHFEIPAGTTDASDTDLESAARRELLEETGYGGGRWSPLMTLSANPALQNNLTHTFLAEDVLPLKEADPGAGEDLRLHAIPIDELETMIDQGDFIQALHAAPLLKFLLKRRGRAAR
jgi:8-oxo-dGTP pyrophosphatase MutT (NUDIX family)